MRFKEFKVHKEHRITPVGPITPIQPTVTNPKFIDDVYLDKTKKQKTYQGTDQKTDNNDKPLVDLIAEKKKRKKTKRTKLGKYFFPGFGYYGGSGEGDSGGGDGGGGESLSEGKDKGLGEQNFTQFLNKALTNKVEPAPKKYDPNTTMGFHNMPGYKNALDFGMAVIGKMDDKTKRYYAKKDEDVLLDYLLKVAKRNNLLITEFSAPTDDDHAEVFRGGKFYEEDLFEVPGLFDEVFHDPNIGSSWTDLLKDNLTEHVEKKTSIAGEVKKFALWACKILKIDKPPKIQLSYNTKEAQQGHHTGRHTEGGESIWVYANNRNLVDILRTVFHELVHWRQSELGLIKPGSSYPGSPIESQADMLAGKYIKIYGKSHRNIFQ